MEPRFISAWITTHLGLTQAGSPKGKSCLSALRSLDRSPAQVHRTRLIGRGNKATLPGDEFWEAAGLRITQLLGKDWSRNDFWVEQFEKEQGCSWFHTLAKNWLKLSARNTFKTRLFLLEKLKTWTPAIFYYYETSQDIKLENKDLCSRIIFKYKEARIDLFCSLPLEIPFNSSFLHTQSRIPFSN